MLSLTLAGDEEAGLLSNKLPHSRYCSFAGDCGKANPGSYTISAIDDTMGNSNSKLCSLRNLSSNLADDTPSTNIG